ncbi:MAG: hypothetical protein AAF561_08575 [Planctomycetota bacterium]
MNRFLSGPGSSMLTLDVDPLAQLQVGDVFPLINYQLGGLIGAFDNVADGQVISAGGFDFRIDYQTDLGSSGIALTATVIPEPLAALGGFAGVALIGLRRRAKV